MSEYQYNKVTPEMIEKFKEIAPKRVLVGDEINEDFTHDEMAIYGKARPEVLVEATSTEEVAAVVKLCNENKVPVTPSGARTGLVGGAVSIGGGVMISLTKMNKILGYDKENFVVKIQSGVLLNDLAQDAEKQGLLYPPDPGEKFATVGGNVATNAGGMRAVKYGCTRDYVRAMTVVLPTGEIVKLGATVSKTSSGYSLLNLMIGSEGTLGIITELTLKVIPAPKSVISLIIPYENLEDCIATVPQFFMHHLAPQALEFMEKEVVMDTEKFLGKQVYPKELEGTEIGAYLLATFDGNSEEQLEDIIEQASEVVLEAGAIDVDTVLLDECDVVVPTNKIAEFLTYTKSLEAEADFRVKSFGHAGDGNLHIYTCSNDMEEGEFKKQVAVFMDKVYAKATEFGGMISGEHGIGHGKMDYLAESLGPVQMRIMEGVKEVFDPNMILNPGKICYKL